MTGISERMYRQFAGTVTVSLSDEAISDAESVGPPPSPETADEEKEVKMPVEQPDTGKQAEAEGYYIIQADTTGDEEAKIEVEPKETGEARESTTHPPTEPKPEEGYILSPEPDDNGNFWRPWLLMVVGALAGACLALLLISGLNSGTLVFENHPKVIELESELLALKEREATLNKEIKAMQEQLEQFDVLSARLQNTEAEIQILKQARDALVGQVVTLENETSEIAGRLAALEKQTTTLDKQVATLEESGEQMQEDIEELQLDTGRFDDFLTKLRDLLLAVQGAPASPPASPTPTPTKKATSTPRSTPTPTPTPTPTATPTPAS